MERMELLGCKREAGKGVSRRLRSEGRVPGILYGIKQEPVALSVDSSELNKVLNTGAGWNILLDLKLDGKDEFLTRIVDHQADVLKRNITHIDFVVLDLKKKITVEVPVKLVGTPVGIEKGGILELIRRHLEITCLPTNIPGHVDIDVTQLDLGENIHIEEVKLPEGVECHYDTNFSIAAIVAPTEELEPELEEEEELPEDAKVEVPEEGEAEEAGEAEAEKKEGGAEEAKKEGSESSEGKEKKE